jgi:hypothetical protein
MIWAASAGVVTVPAVKAAGPVVTGYGETVMISDEKKALVALECSRVYIEPV